MGEVKGTTQLRIPPATDILFHAIDLARIADSLDSRDANLVARACILESAFMLEALANCLLDLLKLSNPDAFEQLRTIAKLELFALSVGKKIDFSRHEYQWAKELVKVRNDYVHPKVVTREMGLVPITGEVDSYSGKNIAYELRTMNAADYPGLKLRKGSPWTPADAKGVLEKLLRFLDKYLIDDCNIRKGQAQKALNVTQLGSNIIFSPTVLGSFIEWCESNLGYRPRLLELLNHSV